MYSKYGVDGIKLYNVRIIGLYTKNAAHGRFDGLQCTSWW